MNRLDHTHRSDAVCWVESARRPGGDFPVQNLPFGVFRRRGAGGPARIGVAIGDEILDLHRAQADGHLDPVDPAIRDALRAPSLNPLLGLGRGAATILRRRLFELLTGPEPTGPGVAECLTPSPDADLLLPIAIGDYTDFYASIHHATNVGQMLRPDQPLLPNYKYVPIGYHGRASSVVVSGTPVRRPMGQLRDEAAAGPVFGPTRALDYECEVGAVVGPGNGIGIPIPLADAERHLFGLCLVNDWSARDIQRWEYQPLGPFLAKSFATSISPWIVTLDALAPFRAAPLARPPGDPEPLSYLHTDADRAAGAITLTVEVCLRTERMRRESVPAVRLSRSSLGSLYWTFGQLLAHHTSNGCPMRPGDLLASGTVSGPARENRGCLLELTWRGTEPLELPTGETRRFLEDGDLIIMRGYCEREGYARIGFGECQGVILAA
jgi:fumarylacetoacetase